MRGHRPGVVDETKFQESQARQRLLDINLVCRSCDSCASKQCKSCFKAAVLASQAYQKDKRLFGFVKDWVSFIYDKALLKFFFV